MIKFNRVKEWKVMYCKDLIEEEYIRMAPDNWLIRMGQNWYDVWDCSELEAAYQAWESEN